MMRILLSLFVAAAASAQTLFLQPERPVVPPRVGLLYANEPLTASNGTTHLLVWSDIRANLPANAPSSNIIICATRVDASGNVLDSPNLVLPLQGTAVPFWNGREYVVVGTGGYVRISADGTLLDRLPRPLTGTSGTLDSATWSGQRLLVITHDKLNSHGAIYDGSMNLIRGGFAIPNISVSGKVASNGDGFMIVSWEDVAILDRDGNLVAQKRVVNYVAGTPSLIASDGTNYMLVVRQYTNETQPHLSFQAISLTPAGVVRTISGLFGLPLYGSGQLTWDGEAYQLAFAGDSRVQSPRSIDARTVTLDRDGNNIDGDGTVLMPLGGSNSRYVPNASGGGRAGSHLLFWTDGTWWRGLTYADSATFNQTASAPFDYSRGALPQETPAVATAGDVSLLVWRAAETKALTSLALYAARFDRYGRMLDAAPMLLSALTCNAAPPAVATDGNDFLVAWQMPASIRAVRIAHDGRLLDPLPIVASAPGTFDCGNGPLDAASNGRSYLLSWAGSKAAYAARIANDGALLDPLPLSLTSGDGVTDVHAASDGRDYFVAWTDTKTGQARGTRLTADGSVLDAAGLPLLAANAGTLYWSGANYVLLSFGSDGVVPVRITADGQRLDLVPGLPPVPATTLAVGPRVDCDARGCFSYVLTNGFINEIRIDDRGSAVTFQSTPLAAADQGWRQLIVFGDTLKNFVYLRLATEPEYASAWHLFIRSSQLRGRAIRR